VDVPVVPRLPHPPDGAARLAQGLERAAAARAQARLLLGWLGLQQSVVPRPGPLPRLPRLHALLLARLRAAGRRGGGRDGANVGRAHRDVAPHARRGAVRSHRPCAELVGAGPRRQPQRRHPRLLRLGHAAGRVRIGGEPCHVARRRRGALVRLPVCCRVLAPRRGTSDREAASRSLPRHGVPRHLHPRGLAAQRLHARPHLLRARRAARRLVAPRFVAAGRTRRCG